MRRYFLIQLLLISSFAICSEASLVMVRIKPSQESVAIQAIESKGVSPLIPLPLLCEKMGYHCTWDQYLQKLTCKKKGSKVIFVQNNNFYSVNGVVFHSPVAPHRLGSTLYLPLSVVFYGMRPFFKDMIQLSTIEKTSEETVEKPDGVPSKYSIISATSEKKQNGTLLAIVLRDSLPFDCTYFYPNLTINFFGGTVDTNGIRQISRIGLVDSIFTLQYKQSAQISLILNREIEEPVIDYVEDSKTLLIALRQKKIKPVLQKKTESISESIDRIKNIDVENVKTIVLDPGHGGKDPGAIGISGVLEKDVVLSIVLKVREMLKKQVKLKILLTRDRDEFIPLSERTKFANDKKADLFISVHADAVPGNVKRKVSTRGYKIYFLSQAKNDEDKLVAMRENAVIQLEEKPQNYGSLQNVLIDLAGNEFLRESQDLCILMDQKFQNSLDKKISKLHLGVGQANFWVLNGAYMPSILIEIGFLSNPAEEKLLSDKKFQVQMAEAIYNAIIRFKEKYETGL